MKENDNKINFGAKLTDKTKYVPITANVVYCVLAFRCHQINIK